jgi:DNA uptake protein ComE-like DNA-binding protein
MAFALVVLIVANTSYNRYRLLLPFVVSDSIADRRMLDSLLLLFPKEEQSPKWVFASKKGNDWAEKQPLKSLKLHEFDPNTVDKDTWMAMGLPERVFSGLSRYREKGGRFRRPEQVLKLYHLPEETGAALLPFVRLDSSMWARKTRTKKWDSANRSAQQGPFDLNLADSLVLEKVPGIGPKTAHRILQFRERLGGFYSKEQLYEIYRIDSLIVLALMDKSFISKDLMLKKVKINQVTEEVMAQHPYVRKGLARILVRYRQQHGPFRNPEDLKGIRILEGKTLDQLKPYLDFALE